jgi:hypothetical protein
VLFGILDKLSEVFKGKQGSIFALPALAKLGLAKIISVL